MDVLAAELELFRAEIARLLASSEFASSRQLQDFLRYTSAKAFEGVTHLDQTDIALAVLGRGSDFNPLEDAAVRKLASQVRQRLEHFYSHPGNAGDMVVSLPVRSYVPRLERRISEPPVNDDSPDQPVLAPEPPVIQSGWRLKVWLSGAVFLGLLLALLSLGHLTLPPPSSPTADQDQPIIIPTLKGDVTQGGADAPGTSVRLGPALRDVDEISARLDFAPRMEAQQAGIIVWQDSHHFLRLGRKFFGRNQIEFLLEEAGSDHAWPGNTVYDSDGQSGQPLWLSIHRDGDRYQAFLSHDGIRWEPHGEPVSPKQPFAAPRAGIYAFNGRRDAVSADASFSHIATGATFGAAVDGSLDLFTRGGWSTLKSCPDTTTAAIEGSALRIAFAPHPGNCNFEIDRPLIAKDWEISTRVDFFPVPGRSAGLHVQGSKASIRLVRYFLNGPSISFINDGKTLVGKPDLNGSPAVILRLRARDGVLVASYSADGRHFEPLPVNVKLDDLGAHLRGGIRFSTVATDQDEPSSIARFYYYREAVTALTPYR